MVWISIAAKQNPEGIMIADAATTSHCCYHRLLPQLLTLPLLLIPSVVCFLLMYLKNSVLKTSCCSHRCSISTIAWRPYNNRTTMLLLLPSVHNHHPLRMAMLLLPHHLLLHIQWLRLKSFYNKLLPIRQLLRHLFTYKFLLRLLLYTMFQVRILLCFLICYYRCSGCYCYYHNYQFIRRRGNRRIPTSALSTTPGWFSVPDSVNENHVDRKDWGR